jgi:hypothetical protein
MAAVLVYLTVSFFYQIKADDPDVPPNGAVVAARVLANGQVVHNYRGMFPTDQVS